MQIFLHTVDDVVEQATALTVYVSYRGFVIPGRSGFAFHNSHNSRSLRVGRNQVGFHLVVCRMVDSRTNRWFSCLWSKTVRDPETVPNTPCR